MYFITVLFLFLQRSDSVLPISMPKIKLKLYHSGETTERMLNHDIPSELDAKIILIPHSTYSAPKTHTIH